MQKTHILLEHIWHTRKSAHDQYKSVEPINYFGYQLGFLYDNPDRVPAKFNYAQGGDVLSGYD